MAVGASPGVVVGEAASRQEIVIGSLRVAHAAERVVRGPVVGSVGEGARVALVGANDNGIGRPKIIQRVFEDACVLSVSMQFRDGLALLENKNTIYVSEIIIERQKEPGRINSRILLRVAS